MRGFRKLVMLGVLLVMLLLLIDHIDAGKKQGKKKELETGKSYNKEKARFSKENKHKESTKQEKIKKSGSQRNANFEEENQFVSKRKSWYESKKTDVKKNIKFTPKEQKYTDENTKTSKQFQKSKKSTFVEEEPVENFDSHKSKVKKTKPQYLRSENVKTVKKTTLKKLVEENENDENVLSEENRLKDEETISIEETIGGSPKKRKYKLVEVVLEEDGQDEEQEINETLVELGLGDQEIFDIESEEITEKTKMTQYPKANKNKKLSRKLNIVEEDESEPSSEGNYFKNTDDTEESEQNEGTHPDDNSFSSRYQDPQSQGCRRLPEDPNRQEPKKLTLYVVEEVIDGEVRKRVIPEEDGVTICEVADLLQEAYARGDLP